MKTEKKSESLRRTHNLSEEFIQCSLFAFKEKERKLVPAVRADERIGAEGELHGPTPMRETMEERMMERRNEMDEMGIRYVFGIETIIANHLKMLIGDMDNKAFNKFKDRKSFNNVSIIFMSIVMKSNERTVVGVNAGRGDNGTSEVSADIFGGGGNIAFHGFGVDIKTMLMFIITFCIYRFKRRSQSGAKKL